MSDNVPDPIAIDGPAASGKTSLGLAIASELDYRFLDTGLMYRAFALAADERDVPPSDHDANSAFAIGLALSITTDMSARILIDGNDITDRLREPKVEALVSAYSAIPGVRVEMVRRQREFAEAGQAVLAGRDIGTVVLPDAPLKFFLTASEEKRAERRSQQSSSWGSAQTADGARRDVSSRDQVDSSRAVSPLTPATDAIIVDTTSMSLDDLIDFAMEKVRCASSKPG